MLSLTNSEVLHAFLDAAAGEGLVLGGVDAADLYVAIFPERYARAIAGLDAGTGAVPAPDSTTPDQGDERRALQALVKNKSLSAQRGHEEAAAAFVTYDGAAADLNELSRYVANLEKAIRALSAAQPGAQEAIPPIERDESMDRTYIPLPGGWEVQTQGKGSTFRICNTKTGDRWPVLCKDIHAALEQMARDAHAAALAAPQPSQGAEELLRDALTNLIETYGTDSPMWWQARAALATPHPPVSADAGLTMTTTPHPEDMPACGDCGMPCKPGEYHPYAACLMFKACHNSETVRANLEAVAEQRTRAMREALLMALAQLRWLAFGECRTDGWEGAPPTAAETEKAINSALSGQSAPGKGEAEDEETPQDLKRAYELLFAENARLRRELEDAKPVVFEGEPTRDDNESSADFEHRLEHWHKERLATPPSHPGPLERMQKIDDEMGIEP